MPENLWILSAVTFLHDLFTVVWIGGMVTLGLGMIPAVRTSLGMGPQMHQIVSAFQSRFRWVAYVCIAGLVVTGVLLSRRSPEFQSWFAWADTYSVLLSLKHLLVIVMVVIVIVRSVLMAQTAPLGMPAPPSPVAARPQPGGRARVAMLLLLTNIAFGVAVLFLSAATATLGTG
ncbi:MAG: CopD family protein [Thermoleophilia bacterium]|nr:CopD family protein [Thermoleophilia bacterium]